MERNTNHQQQHNGGSGFLLGVIVGVILTLLFTTKRGRAILKEVMEKGIRKFADLEDLMHEMEEEEAAEDDENYEDENDYVPAKQIAAPQPPKKDVAKKPEPPPEPKVKEEPEPEPEPEIEDAPTLEEPEPAATVEPPKEELKPPAPPKEEKAQAKVKRLFRGLRRKG